MIVVKIGGGEGNQISNLCQDIKQLLDHRRSIVLIHGGSHLTNELSRQLGHPPRFLQSPSGYTSRYTDRRTMQIFQMAYCGQANKAIVEELQALGVNALGLSGMDGRLWEGRRKKAVKSVENGKTVIVRDNLTGTIARVNVALLRSLVDQGYLPVITPPAIATDHQPINVDGDRAAAATARALQAERLVILSNVAGVLADVDDANSLVQHIPRSQLESAMDQFAAGRMRIKLLAAGEAIDGGVDQVVIGDSRPAACLQEAMAGKGTVISAAGDLSTT